MSRMRRRMVHAYERAAVPAADHWLQRQFPHLKVERWAIAAAVLWALVTAAPAWRVRDAAALSPGMAPKRDVTARLDLAAPIPDAPPSPPDPLPAASGLPLLPTPPAPATATTPAAHHAGDRPSPAGGTATPARYAAPRAQEGDASATVGGAPAPWRRYAGQAALFALIAEAFLLTLARARLSPSRRARIEWGVALAATGLAWSGYALAHYGADDEWLPLGLAVGVVSIGMASLPAAVWTATLATVVAIVALGADMAQAAAMLPAAWMMATLVRGVRRRMWLVAVALLAGAAGLATEAMWVLATGGEPLAAMGVKTRGWNPLAVFVLAGGAGGVLLALFIRPMETWFGVTTRMRLQSLLDLEHPLARRLVSEAPGTYNHSVLVGALAEAGAEAAGGDGLLAKAGGYFHDVGKLFKPGYFTENEQGVSRHDRLSPYLSALIIIAHVKDGGELAEVYGLPPGVVHIVRSHHGAGRAAFFLHRARQRARPDETVSEAQFTYPGPRPATVEAAAVMLADGIEAAARSLGTAGTERLRQLVHRIFMDRLLDGQLADAGLDLAQLSRMEEAMYRMLLGMYHGRVKYPGQDEPRRRR